jgi:hypothetical protein
MTDNRRHSIAALVLGLLAATLLPSIADARPDITSANYMLPACRSFVQGTKVETTAYPEQAFCVGIVSALIHVGVNLPPNVRSCRPDGATIEQAMRVVLAYIERRPQRMHDGFKELALEALHEAWPCN